jgi:Na+/H+ antiporter NhaD/arsenite permease-like protein
MAITLDCTGILRAAAFWVSNKGGSSGRKLYFYFYLLLTVISMIVGNDPVILSGTVFLVYYTQATKLDADAWLISEFAAANTASMVLFVGNPTNVVICEGFRINNAAFTAYTILPFLACSVACYLALMLQFRNDKYVPRRLTTTTKLNPMDVLDDPVSAIFGSIWLFICLVVVIALSFLHVDVWKVVLPFAGGKFIFDIVWDHYRYTTGKIPKYDPDHKEKSREEAMRFIIQRSRTVDDVGAKPANGEKFDVRDPNKLAVSREVTREDTDATLVANPPEKKKEQDSMGHDAERQVAPHHGDIGDAGLHRTDSPARAPSTPSTATVQHPQPAEFILKFEERLATLNRKLSAHWPTFFGALPRLPFGLIPFAFAQFILIEALEHQGWIQVFSRWLVIASKGQLIPIVWLVGIFGVILCNISGTNIGATILLTKIVRASHFSHEADIAAAVALAIASNIGAVSFTFSASLAGLLWESILKDKGNNFSQWKFAKFNMLPLIVMTAVGLSVATVMMVVLY